MDPVPQQVLDLVVQWDAQLLPEAPCRVFGGHSLKAAYHPA